MSSLGPENEIDGFRLGEALHVGTMATIYRLVGPEGKLPLIIKVPRLGPGERSVNVIAFEVCRMVLGALAQGPHHPTLVAYGDVETIPYLVMEYVDGARLSDSLDRAPLPPNEIAELGAALALALHDLHRQDVVHLDLKPTNVLYRASGDAVLIDFGLAHHSHYPDLLAGGLGFPGGNWGYMGAERVLGVRGAPRSDVYAHGGILYELATARTPFGKPDSMAQLRRRLYRDPVPPRSLNAGVPPWLQEIVLHCLEMDARDRYASAAEVAFDLANPAQVAITERGTRLRRAGWATLFRQWMRAKRFEPAPCPPPSVTVGPAATILVAIDAAHSDETLLEALRDAARRATVAIEQCRIACATVVPPAASLDGEGDEYTATGRHIKYLVALRRWA